MRTVMKGLLLATLVLSAPIAMAQSNAEINAGIQFNFSLPGARSLGMGGAFLGLADDATAAYANPAGLTVLAKPEVSVEGRSWRFTNVFADRGHAFGPPTGEGIDTIAGVHFGETDSDTTGASYLSFVYPTEKWAFAVYRHELARFEGTIETTGVFNDCFDGSCGDPGVYRLFPAQASMDLDIVNYGLSAAFELGPKFSLGAGVSFYDMALNSLTRRYDVLNDFYGPPNFDASNVVNYQTQDGDDSAFGFNVGLLWKPVEKLSVGVVFRSGPDFDVDTANIGGPSRGFEGVVFTAQGSKLHVPDVYGLGVAYRATDAFTVTAELTRVQYSQMTDDLVNLFPSDALEAQKRFYTVDDATEIHVGVEYIFVDMTYPLALRAGTWLDPDHQLRFEGADNSSRILFTEGDDELHYAAGLGFVLGQHFQLDFAADLSDRIDVYALSMVARF